MIPINENTRPYIAMGIICGLLLVIGMGFYSTYVTIQDRDQKAAAAHMYFQADPTNFVYETGYNEAARDYIGATAYFPGTVVGPIFGYSPDKWQPTNRTLGNQFTTFPAFKGVT